MAQQINQIKGIDVSKWQGDIDWKKVYADGVKFAFIRAGYFTDYVDPYWEKNYKNAKAAKIKVGAYHYSYAQNTTQAVQEADFVLSLIKGKSLEYPVAYDLEENSQTKLGKKILTDMIIAFCERIKAAGYEAALYTNTNWRNNFIDMKRILGVYPLWQAHYPPNPENRPSAVDDKVSVWQYSGTGKIDGISGNVDMNWDFVDLSKPIISKPETGAETPPPVTPPPSVKIKVGDIVKVNKNAKSYDGVNIAAFVYERTFKVDQLKNDRAVLDLKGICTAFNVKDLTKVNKKVIERENIENG